MRLYFQLLLWLEASVAVLAYLGVAGLLLIQVLGRNFFAYSLYGGTTVAVMCGIVAGSLGMVIATGENAHFRASFADGVLPFSAVNRIGDVISALIHIGLGYYAIIFVSESMAYGDKVEIIHVPLWPIQLVFPYMFFSSALKHLVFAWKPEWKPRPVIRD